MKKNIAIINGPNLNLLGKRDPDLYGYQSLDEVMAHISKNVKDYNISHFQSNHEGAIIDHIHHIIENENIVALIINPGAYTHYSYAIADALAELSRHKPVVEVHLSNILAREDFRATSVTARHARAVIAGAGAEGYLLAARFIESIDFDELPF